MDHSPCAGISSTVSPHLPLFVLNFSFSRIFFSDTLEYLLFVLFIFFFFALFLFSVFFPVVRPDGKGSRPYVFSLVPNASMRAGPLLDVAANSQEELKEWMVKIREVTMTSEAKVKTCVEQLPDQDTLLAGRLLNLYLRNTG